jgi:glycosyltransferase involved in cell wall biosynthesis
LASTGIDSMPLVKDSFKMLRRLLMAERLRRELRRRKLLLDQRHKVPQAALDFSPQAGVSKSETKPRWKRAQDVLNGAGAKNEVSGKRLGFLSAIRRTQGPVNETVMSGVRALLDTNTWLRENLTNLHRRLSDQTNKVDKHQRQLTELRNTLRELRRQAATHQQFQGLHLSPMERARGTSRSIVVAVDLLPLIPGGENGGLKPAIFSLLRELAHQAGGSLIFVFLTKSSSHGEVRQIAGPHDILICALEDPLHGAGAIEKAERAEFKLIPPPPELLRAIDVDLLYCPFGMTPFYVPGIPTIALIADVLHRDYPFSLTQQQISEREAYIQETIRVATKIQCISRSGVDRLVAHYNKIEATKLFYTYLPIHLRLGGSSNGADKETKGPVSRPFFFYPANLWIHKNHEILLLSYARYRERAGGAAWDLLLTFHEEPRAAELRSLARALGISEYVRFAGFVCEHELHNIWQTAGALVFPSLHEGFGIPLVEAMHYGVPIITSAEFALKEVAGDACYLIDPHKPCSLANALLEVSTNAELRAELVRRARERLMLFDLKIAARVLLDQFYSAIRTEEEFPRRPGAAAGQTAILTSPTPASEERWQIEIACCRTGSHQKLSVYLDDFPYGTFHRADREDAFSFVCRPQGRILGVRRAPSTNSKNVEQSDSSDHPVTRIVAHDLHGRRIILYEKPTTFLNG